MLFPNFFFDLIPIILAGIGLSHLQLIETRSMKLYIASACAILLIICQSAWVFSYTINQPLVTTAIDYMWSVFNSLAMILVIMTVRDYHA